MGPVRIADIHRPESTDDKSGPSITNVEHLASYNWIESSGPIIAVPGCPPRWSPPRTPKKVPKDAGLIYIAQNACRHPESPLEPLFRSLYVEHPSYNIREVDLITDRNNVRKLLSFINPHLSKDGLEPFTIDVEITGNTAIFCRAETETHTFIGPHDFRGYGHEFEKAFTTTEVSGSTGHHRIISYNFGGLKFIVRYETDAYVDDVSKPQSVDENVLNMMENLSLSRPNNHSRLPTESGLIVQEDGKRVPIKSTLEIKTRVSHKPIDIQEVLPQLWVSQTPNLVRAYHSGGIFGPPEVKDVTREIAEWEECHADDLWRLVVLVKEIIRVVRENEGNAVLKYDGRSGSLAVWAREGRRMLPDDLYLKLGGEAGPIQAIESNSRKTTLKIGDTFYDVDISAIPYLSSFVRSQRLAQPQNTTLVHGNIALFDIALKGLESGYRQCFRSLRGDIPQYHTLCETYDFLGVDVLAGQSIDGIFADLRACKPDYDFEYERYRAVRGDKSRARDAAFRLLFLIICSEFRDEKKDAAKVYNAVLFVVSHPGTFKQATRTAVRSVFDERFVVSTKQRSQLDRWKKEDAINSGDENTTEDEYSEPYLSDES
ncbi:hypothetical protein McanMca71_007571 [Microsporum canis]|uniref:Geranylgeranyl pyrophosphate synthetase n=1 Tax=Arthroderma otae (strain ATCC MYA-4605 / CBS 113480) TaxID=554155 RepID=C5G0Q2_ARTOC|nr:conserved hypothetical protein [Microsporum canis CBS 113480]EEQ35705.1 conserved hypothetical protein [Microsporum canis CBS 113480]